MRRPISQPRHASRPLPGIALLVACGVAASAHAGVQYQWLQLLPHGVIGVQAVVRAIVAAGDPCPSLSLAGDELGLTPTERGKPEAGFETIELCEAFLGPGHTQGFSKATLSGAGGELTVPDLSLGVPLTELTAFGCTGCRGAGVQSRCDRSDWPFWQVNEHAAEHTSSDLPPWWCTWAMLAMPIRRGWRTTGPRRVSTGRRRVGRRSTSTPPGCSWTRACGSTCAATTRPACSRTGRTLGG
jgi:hypothetical protein